MLEAPSEHMEVIVDEGCHNGVIDDTRLSSGGNTPGECEEVEWQVGAQYHLTENRLFFSVHPSDEFTREMIRIQSKTFYFSSNLPSMYQPICLDFGPTNVPMLVRFCREIREKFNHPKLQHRPLVYYCSNSREEFTNTAMNLAAYLMLEHGYTPEHAVRPFTRLSSSPLLCFRDATWIVPPTFCLDMLSCLRGLQRAISKGFFPSTLPANFLDEFDVHMWEELDNPMVLNMNQVSPKFIAFVGPVNKPREKLKPYEHAPEEFIRVFHQHGVKTIIRLNEASTYDSTVFTKAGFNHQEIFFDDCTVPNLDVIEHFLDVSDSTPGVVAVHCLAGLGRTGTLIAIYLIKNEGFSAREALGYLRLVRPGSVIGPQQHFLEVVERATWWGNRMLPHPMDVLMVKAGPSVWCSAAASKMMATHVMSGKLAHDMVFKH